METKGNERQHFICVCPDCIKPRAGLREQLQQQCVDWNAYWRASDAHGVLLSHEQALDLLRNALGVEVEITKPEAP